MVATPSPSRSRAGSSRPPTGARTATTVGLLLLASLVLLPIVQASPSGAPAQAGPTTAADGIVSGIIEWTKEVFGPWGAPGLFVVALFEANLLPFAVDPLIVFFTLGDPSPHGWVWWGLVATVGSIAGSLLGYVIGWKGGHPVLVRVVGKRQADAMERYYARWGMAAVFITAITPLPYKAFTIGSGVLELDLRKFTIAAAVGRGLRFFAVAYASAVMGDAILGLLDEFFWPAVAVSAALIAVWALWAWWRQRRAKVDQVRVPTDWNQTEEEN